jgi:hypothetical protein
MDKTHNMQQMEAGLDLIAKALTADAGVQVTVEPFRLAPHGGLWSPTMTIKVDGNHLMYALSVSEDHERFGYRSKPLGKFRIKVGGWKPKQFPPRANGSVNVDGIVPELQKLIDRMRAEQAYQAKMMESVGDVERVKAACPRHAYEVSACATAGKVMINCRVIREMTPERAIALFNFLDTLS